MFFKKKNKIECNHKWVVLDKTILKSAFEQINESSSHTIDTTYENIFTKTVVTILTCTKCGELDKIIVVNPPLNV